MYDIIKFSLEDKQQCHKQNIANSAYEFVGLIFATCRL